MKTFIKLILSIALILFIMGCPKDDDTDPSSDQATFDVYTSPSDPQLFTAHHPDGTEVTYQGVKDRDGNVISINSYTVIFPGETEPYIVTVNDEGIPSEVYANNGCVYKYAWESSTKVIVTAISPSGEFEVITPIDFSEKGVQSINKQKFNNIRSGKPIDVKVVSNLSNSTVTKDSKAGWLGVSLKKCGVYVAGASVTIKITPWDGGVLCLYPMDEVGGYACMAPLIDEEPVDWGKMCSSAVGVIDYGCPYVKEVDPTAACTIFAVAVDWVCGGPTGEAIPLKAACLFAWKSLQAYCNTAGLSGDGDQSISAYFCDQIKKHIQNPPPSTSYQARAIASIPGEGVFDGGWKTFTPGSNQAWAINASGEKKVKNFKTNPPDPNPYQSYNASANIFCPEQTGTKVTISVVGTDGYTASKTITLYEQTYAQEISINVPGAEAGVHDKLSIAMQDGPTKVIGIMF